MIVCVTVGLGESMADHATPTLDAGMQMLQSLEASGDLDTPLSAESEVGQKYIPVEGYREPLDRAPNYQILYFYFVRYFPPDIRQFLHNQCFGSIFIESESGSKLFLNNIWKKKFLTL